MPPSTVAVGLNSKHEHTGLAYKDKEGTIRFVHLAMHYDLRDELPKDTYYYQTPNFPEEVLTQISTTTRRIIKRCGQNLPYALSAPTDSFHPDTGVFRADRVGLTCATFVVAVFSAARYEIVDVGSWPSRAAEDAAFKSKVISIIRATFGPAATDHIQKIEAEPFHSRIKPLEVFGAAHCDELPASFAASLEKGAQFAAANPAA